MGYLLKILFTYLSGGAQAGGAAGQNIPLLRTLAKGKEQESLKCVENTWMSKLLADFITFEL